MTDFVIIFIVAIVLSQMKPISWNVLPATRDEWFWIMLQFV